MFTDLYYILFVYRTDASIRPAMFSRWSREEDEYTSAPERERRILLMDRVQMFFFPLVDLTEEYRA